MTRLQDIKAAIDLAADYWITSELPAGDSITMGHGQGIDGRGCRIFLGDGKLLVCPPTSPILKTTIRSGTRQHEDGGKHD